MMLNMISEMASHPATLTVIALTAATVIFSLVAGIHTLLTSEPVNLDSLN